MVNPVKVCDSSTTISCEIYNNKNKIYSRVAAQQTVSHFVVPQLQVAIGSRMRPVGIPASLTLKFSAGLGALLGGGMAGMVDYESYKEGKMTGKQAIVDTIEEAGIGATSASIGTYAGIVVGSIFVPGLGAVVGGVAGAMVGVLVGWGLVELKELVYEKWD